MENLPVLLKELIVELERTPGAQSEPANQLLPKLTTFLKAVDSGDALAMAMQVAGLRQFWLHSVPWCSQLSKSLEKVLMVYDELAERG